MLGAAIVSGSGASRTIPASDPSVLASNVAGGSKMPLALLAKRQRTCLSTH